MRNSSENQRPAPLAPRVPPHDIRAEMAVLGAMMLGDPGATDQAIELLADGDFYRDAHSHIFRAIAEMRTAKIEVDGITLQERMQRAGTLEGIGGGEYLYQLSNAEFTTANIPHYARIVAEKAVYRRLIDAASKIAAGAYAEAGESSDGFVNTSAADIAACESARRTVDLYPVHGLVSDALNRVNARKKAGVELAGVSTGIHLLDRITNGMVDGDLIIVGARPSMGKTALAVTIARNVGARKTGVAIFSAEMRKESIADRMLASESEVWLTKILRGSTDEYEDRRMKRATETIARQPIFIDDEARTVQQIESAARRLKSSKCPNLGLIIIDYLQYLSGTEGKRYAGKHEEISDITHGLKEVARTLNVPVVVLAQLNRSLEHRPNKEPILSDLRESGKIEEEADVIMFLYRASYYAQKDEGGTNQQEVAVGERDETKIIIAKGRNGATGFVRAGFSPHFVRFDNLAESKF